VEARAILGPRGLRFVGRVGELRRWLRAWRDGGRLADLLARRN
jgi:hypothetical protein